MPMDKIGDLNGDLVVKSVMGKPFDYFRKILQEEDLEDFFRATCFGMYLDLPEDNNVRFQRTIVYGLLKRRIICSKNDEIWINYCGMPVCFGIKEFAIITGLRCHAPSRPLPTVTLKKGAMTPKSSKGAKTPKSSKAAKKSKKGKAKVDDDLDLVDVCGKSYKAADFLADLKSETMSRKHKESLCLVWFVNSILWARDVKNNIQLGLIKLSEDHEAFNNYPWGHKSFKLTVEYLSKALNPNVKTSNIYGFPWAFMAWAFEAIPHLRSQVRDYSEEVYFPRILRWLTTKNNNKKMNLDPFNPPPPRRQQ
ncbi:uncharacterized protein LOC132036731 isoform X2 [Lycium ferocissimum]|uniref:uncharacterized protein LOC132036731 isoform X2 n=1 Tax=Lycium ferocissimum TaxID=112874 RepID=UPI0028160DEB|nr:uncharacterized protein LOC132036731 isoform X2 [Lycium ferocissimum]